MPHLVLLLLVASGIDVWAQKPAGVEPAVGAAATMRIDSSKTNETVTILEPEGGGIVGGAYDNKYFALSYPVPPNWTEAVKGPPPSDAGYYVLDSFKLAPTAENKPKGTILVAAWDLFFVPRPAKNALELVKDIKGSLSQMYEVESAPAEVKIAGHSFVRLDYGASAAQLHWKVLATEIRCHMVEFVFTGRDVAMLEGLVRNMSKLQLPEGADATSGTGGGQFPTCIKDYATGPNVVHKVDPVMAGPRYTNVPVRVIIGTDGKVRHIHVINGSPEQDKSVRDALAQWSFKPYVQNGVAAEVETGILFKFPPDGTKLPPVPEKY
jgi:TonB family protein